jgi:phosphate-selective porin OprO/OprP
MRFRKSLLGLVAVLTMPLNYLWAQQPQSPADERQALEQEIQDLKKRLDALDQRLKAQADAAAKGAAAASVTTVGAVPVSADVASAAAAENTIPAVGVGSRGFIIQSADGNFLLKIGADLQVDDRTYVGKATTAPVDTILLRRARPVISGTFYKYVDFYFRPDFGQGAVVIYDAYLQLNYIPHFSVRVGKFKPPVGLERLQEDDNTTFVERGLPTLLVPQRDIGYQIMGDFLNRRAAYQLGVFNGVPDSSLSDTAVNDHRTYAGRIFLTPFLPDDNKLVKGLGVGFAASGGNLDGLATPSYKTFGQNSFFSFASGVTAAGHETRLAPQAYYYLGPFGVLSEYTLAEEGLQKGTVRGNIQFRAWQVEVSYILTGESKGFSSVTPRRNFDPYHHGGWGAVEIAARTGEFDAEHGIFNYGFASPTATPRLAREYVGGVNWYLNQILRISLDYGVTGFEGGIPSGDKLPERALTSRFQLNFNQ